MGDAVMPPPFPNNSELDRTIPWSVERRIDVKRQSSAFCSQGRAIEPVEADDFASTSSSGKGSSATR